jgi:Mn-containing catalase
LENQPALFIASKYIPEGVKIRDPSKMHSAELKTMLSFLLNRQLQNRQVFRFRKSLKNARTSVTPVNNKRKVSEKENSHTVEEFVQGSSSKKRLRFSMVQQEFSLDFP